MFGLEDLRRLIIQIQGEWVFFRLFTPPSCHLFSEFTGRPFGKLVTELKDLSGDQLICLHHWFVSDRGQCNGADSTAKRNGRHVEN